MSKLYKDKEDSEHWKAARTYPAGPTRAQAQAKVNADYALRKIDLPEWRRLTDELSEPIRWTREGRVLG